MAVEWLERQIYEVGLHVLFKEEKRVKPQSNREFAYLQVEAVRAVYDCPPESRVTLSDAEGAALRFVHKLVAFVHGRQLLHPRRVVRSFNNSFIR